MLRSTVTSTSSLRSKHIRPVVRHLQMRAASADSSNKAAESSPNDISAVFPSLSGKSVPPMEPRFVDVQQRLIQGNESKLIFAWKDLIESIRHEANIIAKERENVIPQIEFSSIITKPDGSVGFTLADEAAIRKRGCAVIRNVVDQKEARDYKDMTEAYIKDNPGKIVAFPADQPSVYELYWSKAQLRARSHPNMIKAQLALNSVWSSSSSSPQRYSTHHVASYADRLRIRLPGDAKFTLGPHIDGGSIERWEDVEYSNVYKDIFSGNWQKYDPFDLNHRLNAVSDMYGGGGACSMFRTFQGWLSMSWTGPNKGTLLVNPLIRQTTAYTLMRPFFSSKTAPAKNYLYDPLNTDISDDWNFVAPTRVFPNTALGAGQELNPKSHPHLDLKNTMVPTPDVNPGDYVAWHCDTIHAVEPQHAGTQDSSVMYIPACPLTESNIRYLKEQRSAFEALSPAPDFPDAGGVGESRNIDVGSIEDVYDEGKAAFGLTPFDISQATNKSERRIVEFANKFLAQ